MKKDKDINRTGRERENVAENHKRKPRKSSKWKNMGLLKS
jgi:hypothetical protein